MNHPMPPTSQRWKPSPLLRASALLHGGAALATVLRPHWWPWTLGAVIADHLWLTALGLWPRSGGLGANMTRLPAAAAARGEVAITIDDGPDPEVTPRVLAILAEHRVHATFFCIGERAALFPPACATAPRPDTRSRITATVMGTISRCSALGLSGTT